MSVGSIGLVSDLHEGSARALELSTPHALERDVSWHCKFRDSQHHTLGQSANCLSVLHIKAKDCPECKIYMHKMKELKLEVVGVKII